MAHSGAPSSVGSWRKWGRAAALVAGVLGAGSLAVPLGSAWARDNAATGQGGVGVIERLQLPVEAQQTERLVRAGGPFPYSKDGTVFGNRERLLPRQARGHYREYTVPTPGARDRGARRLVCGGRQPRDPEVCFYTDDHYASFRRIAP